ncbi:LutC/YkgG family protein [Geminisphaera colitermitum]|uniref:LutC/YkgG family protein n=1 Tax=Geminisphaera colitermitum TaxID=1148786 RepID=UPI000158D34E|nr:LUD domain-containing protein [Geminisphaera colitermitum]
MTASSSSPASPAAHASPASRSSRDTILARVRDALAPIAERAAYPEFPDDVAVSPAIASALTGPDADLWRAFSERAKLVHGTPLAGGPAALAAWLREKKLTHGYCDPVLLAQFAPALTAPPPGAEPITLETTFDRTRVDDYQFGITRALAAIAETGSLVLGDLTTSSRLAALAPWVHIATLTRAQLHATVTDAIAAFPDDPNLIWCTGPSRTADVEGILIEGVHGPGEQIALLMD